VAAVGFGVRSGVVGGRAWSHADDLLGALEPARSAHEQADDSDAPHAFALELGDGIADRDRIGHAERDLDWLLRLQRLHGIEHRRVPLRRPAVCHHEHAEVVAFGFGLG
jgi:hypothetical protein